MEARRLYYKINLILSIIICIVAIINIFLHNHEIRYLIIGATIYYFIQSICFNIFIAKLDRKKYKTLLKSIEDIRRGKGVKDEKN